jgi:hypothetical protein
MEKDDVLSAIRLADIFFLPHPLPPEAASHESGQPLPPNLPMIMANALVSLRATADHKSNHKFEVKILNTRSELLSLVEPIEMAFTSRVEVAPTSCGFIVPIRLVVRSTGNCYVCLFMDGEEVCRSPITIEIATQPPNV